LGITNATTKNEGDDSALLKQEISFGTTVQNEMVTTAVSSFPTTGAATEALVKELSSGTTAVR
jgi:hypothetical protein